MNTSRRLTAGRLDSADNGASGGGVSVDVDEVPVWVRRRTTDVLLWSALALLVLRQVLVSATDLGDLHPLVLAVLFTAVGCLLLQRLGTWWRHRLVRLRTGETAVNG